MLYILDTDHLSLFQRRHAQVVAKLQATPLPQRAIAIILVTRHRSDFGQIPGLLIEDWSVP